MRGTACRRTSALARQHACGAAQVYHDLVPVVVSVLGGDRGRVRVALLAGSALPLAMFLAWDAVMLALPALAGVLQGCWGRSTETGCILM